MTTPLTDCTRKTYTSLFNNDGENNDKFNIYGELRNFIEGLLGKAIAEDSSLQSFDCWMVIDDELEAHRSVYWSWIDNLPKNSIEGEKSKIILLAEDRKLFELADLRRFGKNKEQEANNYLAHIEENKHTSLVTYIDRATRSSDTISFKEDINLRLRLLKRLNIVDWLFFVDSLRYPILQDHAMMFLSDLPDFIKIIEVISTNTTLKTSNDNLLLISLQNYFEFVDRILQDLEGLSKEREYYYGDSETAKHIAELSKQEHKNWIDELIPSSFISILNFIFPSEILSQSKYFLSFFEWLNTHSKLYINHRQLPSRVILIDLLNHLFQERLNKCELNKHFLINNLLPEQLNWNALSSLILIVHKDNSDADFRDKLYNLYITYIERNNFLWHANENVNFNELLNNAYYFSILLCGYSEAEEKWNEVYKKFRVNYEGWLTSGSSPVYYHQEAYILSAGIGIAYFKYKEGKKERADEFIDKICSIALKQLRVSNQSNLADYLTPLKFAMISIGQHANDVIEPILAKFLIDLDSLKGLLILVNELSNYADGKALSKEVKDSLNKRINGEFWLIDSMNVDIDFKKELTYLRQIKEHILKKFLAA